MKKTRILIVDDQRSTAEMVVNILTTLGYEPLGPAACGATALRLAEQLRPDLVLMDVNLLDDSDGIEAAEAIRERLGIRSVLITGRDIAEVLPRAHRAAPVGFLNKPFTGATLDTTIQMALHLRDTQEQLHRNHQTLAAILQTAPDGLMVTDLQGRIIEANDTACRLTGQTHTELLQRTVLECAANHGTASDVAALQAKLASRVPRFSHACRGANDCRLEVTFCAQLENAASDRFVCFLRDVTAHWQNEEKLRTLLRAVEQSPVSIVITDATGRIEYVNPRFIEVTGYTAAEALGQNPRVLKSDEHSLEFYRELWTTILDGREWHGELCNRKKNGERYWEQASISPIRDDAGRVTHFVAVKEDITARKHTERALRASEEQFRAVAQSATDAIVTIDGQGLVRLWNPAAEAVFGFTAEEIVGRPVAAIVPEVMHSRHETGVTRTAAHGESRLIGRTVEVTARRKDGSELPVELSLARWQTQDGTFFTAILRDITARKQAEARLLQSKVQLEDGNAQLTTAIARERELAAAAEDASRAKSSFLASMSHELRTPLNVINGVSATMLQEFAGTKPAESAQLIFSCGEHLLEIISEILDFSVLQNAQAKLDVKPFDLLAVISAAWSKIAVTARQKPLELSLWIAPGTPTSIESDPRRLQQILLNLLSNAVKFTERGGIHLSVTARPLGGGRWRWSFSVADTGIGIKPANLGKLFQAFSQANGEIARDFGGTGLGLAICRAFARLMGGDIVVRSQHGRGSCFRCSIVAAEAAPHGRTVASIGSPALRGHALRIIAPDSRSRRLLAAITRAWGMHPKVYSGARWAKRIQPAAEPPELGLVECGEIASAPASLSPVIWIERSGAADAGGRPAERRLAQPLDVHELNRALEHAIAPSATPANASHATHQVAPERPKTRLAERVPLRVLAADDISTNRVVLRGMMEYFGYQTDLCVNGAEVLAALSRQRYDLLLLDVQMPVMDGLTTAREINRLYPHPAQRPKIVALTANALPGDRETCLNAGMDDYLSKPVLPDHLEAGILRWFAGDRTPPPPPVAMLHASVAAELPLIDHGHLAAAFPGMSGATLVKILTQMEGAALADYDTAIARLIEACTLRDTAAAAVQLHALKGCFLTIGWKRLATRCTEALHAARAGTFDEWTSLPQELHELYTVSSIAMAEHLDHLAHPVPAVNGTPVSAETHR